MYQFKVIGSVEGGFQTRVLDAVADEVESTESVECSVRETRGGRHVALTLNVAVQTPEQVQSIYTRIRGLDGLILRVEPEEGTEPA